MAATIGLVAKTDGGLVFTESSDYEAEVSGDNIEEETAISNLDHLIGLDSNGNPKKLPASNVSGSVTDTFDNEEVAGGIIEVEHGLGEYCCHVTVTNDSGKRVLADITDIDSNTISIDVGGPITGTWRYRISK